MSIIYFWELCLYAECRCESKERQLCVNNVPVDNAVFIIAYQTICS